MAQVAVRQFAGDIRFWEFGTGNTRVPVIMEPNDPQGNQPVETDALTFGYEPGAETNIVSKRRDGRYMQPVHTDTLPGATNVTATLLELPPIMLARVLFGSSSSATVAAGTAADEPFTVGNVDLPVQMPFRMLTGTSVIKKGATTLVAGTDYTIDQRRGQIMAKSGGAIVNGDALTLSGTYAAHVALTIKGGAVPTKSFFITGDMQDRISGKNGELTIPEARLTVDGEVDWLSAEPIQATLTGVCVVADGYDAPYTFVEYSEST